MIKLCIASLCLLFLVHCRQGPEIPEDTASAEESMSISDLPAKETIQAGAREITNGWPEFQSLDTSMEGLYRVENKEELRLLLDEMLEKEKALSGSEYPEVFDKPQIFSRQKVFRTYLLKTKASLEYRTDTQEAAKEMILAYNALSRQFNVLIHSKLDSTLLSDE